MKIHRVIAGISNTPLTGQRLWADELVSGGALFCPETEKSVSKADEPWMVNGIRMQKARRNHCIKDPMDISSIIIMAVQSDLNMHTDHGYRMPRSGRRGISEDNRASQVVSLRNPCVKNTMNIATWNIRSMYEPGKMHNVIQEMQRLNIDVLGISDTRWPGCGNFLTTNGMMYFSGNNDKHHRYGVAVVLSKRMTQSVINFTPVSDRVLFLQLQSKTTKLNIIQVYAPTADKTDEEVEQFYAQIDQVLKSIKPRDVTFILGDFNSKIGQEKSGKHVGDYGLGTRNERGDRLLQFCQENNMIVSNTFYELPKRRLYTWTSPQDNTDKTVRNQIDFILVNERYRNSIKSVKAYPGADAFSDHNPLIARVCIKLKKLAQKSKNDQIDINRLQNSDTKEKLKRHINNNLQNLNTNTHNIHIEEVDNKWQILKTAMLEPAKQILTKEKRKEKQEWITDEIVELMHKRRSYKGKCIQNYKEVHKQIRAKIRIAKENFFRKKCEEIEELQAKHDSFNVHKKVKELAGTQKRKLPNVLCKPNGEIITDIQEKLTTWKTYVEELFDDERQRPNINSEQSDEGPDITKEEIVYAIKTMKNGKSPGPDELPSEILKLVEDESLNTLVDLFNSIYKTGVIPQEWLRSTFVTIPKKANAKQCTDHRTISLMSHALKVFLKVIHTRVHKKLEMDIGDTQFGFRNGLGTREALFALNVLSQRCLDMNQDIYIYIYIYICVFHRL